MSETKRIIERVADEIILNPQAFDKEALVFHLEMIADHAKKELIKDQIAHAEKQKD